jgi:hypothetical protein
VREVERRRHENVRQAACVGVTRLELPDQVLAGLCQDREDDEEVAGDDA